MLGRKCSMWGIHWSLIVKYAVGNGECSYLWHDLAHLMGIYGTICSKRLAYDSTMLKLQLLYVILSRGGPTQDVRNTGHKVNQQKILLFSPNMLLFFWLAILDKLPTFRRISKGSTSSGHSLCLLCNHSREARSHTVLSIAATLVESETLGSSYATLLYSWKCLWLE